MGGSGPAGTGYPRGQPVFPSAKSLDTPRSPLYTLGAMNKLSSLLTVKHTAAHQFYYYWWLCPPT